MKNKLVPIGGEFWNEDYLQNESIDNQIDKQGSLLSGGKSAIEFILRDINFRKDEVLLIPAYLCPSIVNFIEATGVTYAFYNVNLRLEIDIENINQLINRFNIRAIFFINYFGFYHSKKTIQYLLNLKANNIILIEDAVQMFWIDRQKKFIGDYVFNSYRKFLPIDGSMVLCDKKIELEPIEDLYFTFMKKGRQEKTDFINGNEKEEKFLNLFNLAHENYYKRTEIYGINKDYKKFLNHIPTTELIEKRKVNYQYILKELRKIPEVTILYDVEDLEDNVPLIFPIYIENRDYIRKELMKYHIYSPVHWNLSQQEWIEDYPISNQICRNILGLPIDWRYSVNDMKYVIKSLKEILEKYRGGEKSD